MKTTGEKQTGGNFHVLPNGNLEIGLPDLYYEEMEEMENFEGTDDEFLWKFFESELCNGYFLVPVGEKGLTDAPVISDSILSDVASNEDARVWYYNDYMIHSVKEILLRDKKVIFTKN